MGIARECSIMSRHLNALLAATALLGLAAAFLPSYLFAQPKMTSILVHRVTSVDCTLEKSNPPNMLLKAKGEVLTGGHTNPKLVLVLYVMPPVDGIQDLHFLIDPPGTGAVVTQVITEVETPIFRLEHVPIWMKGVRVQAATNTIEKSCS
jgi:hypothetical protein